MPGVGMGLVGGVRRRARTLRLLNRIDFFLRPLLLRGRGGFDRVDRFDRLNRGFSHFRNLRARGRNGRCGRLQLTAAMRRRGLSGRRGGCRRYRCWRGFSLGSSGRRLELPGRDPALGRNHLGHLSARLRRSLASLRRRMVDDVMQLANDVVDCLHGPVDRPLVLPQGARKCFARHSETRFWRSCFVLLQGGFQIFSKRIPRQFTIISHMTSPRISVQPKTVCTPSA